MGPECFLHLLVARPMTPPSRPLIGKGHDISDCQGREQHGVLERPDKSSTAALFWSQAGYVDAVKGHSSRVERNEPGDEPEAVFKVDAGSVSAREHCNVHGLWKG